MKIIDRYLAKQSIVSILLVSVALLGFDLFFTLVHELKVVGRAQYTLSMALSYLLLTAPTRLYAMFPWSALIGTLISLGALASHSELVVLRTAGVSVMRIGWAVLKGTFILLVVVVFLGEGIGPVTEKLAQKMKMNALSSGQTIETVDGWWVRQGKEFIHVQSVRSDQYLTGVTCYQFDEERRLTRAFFAEKAEKKGKDWILKNVHGTQFLSSKTKTFHQKEMKIALMFDMEVLEASMIKHPERLSAAMLWRTIQNREQNALNVQAYQVAFWTKIFQPVAIIVMIFLAIPFVFGPLRSASTGLRIVVGILVAFSFHTLNNLFTSLAIVYQFYPLLAVLTPILILLLVAGWMVKRAR
jgi:lipopolysaccharide export system permease protein